MNAAVYVWKHYVFMTDPKVFYDDTRLRAMPLERFHDFDMQIDLQFVSRLMEKRAAR